ncbi:hypothetical protein OG746_04675 [Streptomyces sp. NBC_01016]|uniref:hypothetical protein n=1 Tax=Streptomyces sp. NBC_01016 TaxID=2903720 RepID=UPI0022558972|nr:hypothetical protein [Streptomyces sp. NBC_01016]MCX4828030.1 hypothetical protein [Streptomyces sp. NBC_01016]
MAADRAGRMTAAGAARAVHGEWTKLRTVPGQLWTVVSLTGAMIAFTALIAASAEEGQSGVLAPTALSLSGVYLAQTAAALVAIAVVCGEYPRMIRTTLAANPRRTTVFLAKAAVTAAAVLAAALPAVLGSLAAGRAVLSGSSGPSDSPGSSGFPQLPLSSPELWRATLGTVVYLLLVALLSVGVALVVRHAAAAVGAVMALLYGPYLATLIITMPEHVLHRVQKLSPMTAGLAVQTTTGPGTAPLAPWNGIAVLAAYAGGALVVGWAVLRRRDA